MSLINDALKRARHEALRQDSASGPTVYGAVPAHSRRPRRPWLLFLAGLGVAAAVLLVGWLVIGRGGEPVSTGLEIRESAGAVDKASEGPPTEAASAEPAGESAVLPEEPTVSRPPTRAEQELPAAGAPPAETDQAASSPTEAPAVDEPSAVTIVPEVEPGPAPVVRQGDGERLVAGEIYLRRAASADGSEVRLGGIAYSDTHPIAVINGSVVSPGDMIAGFTVIGIEPERVELESDGVRVFLTLH